MDYKCHEVLEQKMCKEVEMIEAKYAQNPSAEMSMQDLEKLNKLYHTLKSQAAYTAMKDPEAYMEESGFSGESYTNTNNQNGYSGRRGRAANGRYVSRESANSYADGYSQGYSEAMNQMNGNSGHYPMPYSDQHIPRRW